MGCVSLFFGFLLFSVAPSFANTGCITEPNPGPDGCSNSGSLPSGGTFKIEEHNQTLVEGYFELSPWWSSTPICSDTVTWVENATNDSLTIDCGTISPDYYIGAMEGKKPNDTDRQLLDMEWFYP